MGFSFRSPDLTDAKTILDWRTKPEITRYMFTDIPYDLDRQKEWLKSCAERSDFQHFMIHYDEREIGYLSYSGIDRINHHCMPAIYMDVQGHDRVLASAVNGYIAAYAFCRLGMHKILYYIMADNVNFIQTSRRLGVHEVGVLREHIFKDGRYHDVHIFERSRAEWEKATLIFPLDKMLAAFPGPG